MEWCGRSFYNLEAKCGHVDVEIPPGCYTVFASLKQSTDLPVGNAMTQAQIVRANCGDHVCVTLFAPTVLQCGSYFAYAVRTQLDALAGAGVDRRAARSALEAVERLVGQLPPEPYTVNTMRLIEGAEK